MKLRLDLLEQMTPADIAEQAEKNVHRFKPEPLFSKTGVGSLSPASTSERAQEVEHSMELTQKLERRARKAGQKSGTKN
jgi:acetylornithine deacetylase/succinyl-diaminopimelate desuccinylase-like protein